MNWDNIEFKNEKRFLSNMYPTNLYMDSNLPKNHDLSKFSMFEFDDFVYPSSENLYQALKVNSKEDKEQFTTCLPHKAKVLGRKVLIRDDWESVKLLAMELCLLLKFDNNSLASKLLATGGTLLEERNDWKDSYWGTYLGKGENHLGLLLMSVRDTLRKSNIPINGEQLV